MKIMNYFAIVLISGIIFSCNNVPKSLDHDAYMRWIANEDKGLSKHTKIRNIDVSSRFLPTDYLAYKEWITEDSASYDSIFKSYKCGLTFQLQLTAEKTDKTYGNLMYYNIPNEEEFKLRSRYLNFNIQDFVWLQSKGIKYEPVLSHFEGYDQLGNKINFQLVFILPEYNCGDIKPEFENLILTFDDPYWDLGKINFEFEKNNIVDMPKLEF